MHATIRNVLALVAGIIIGSIVNMGLIAVSGHVIAPPGGADMTTAEGLKASMHLFEPKHFVFPFLAHALGTFAGAGVAAYIASSRQLLLAMTIGAVFLAGGISMVLMLPSPIWFDVLDLGGAYLPMAWLAWKLASAARRPSGGGPVRHARE
ncbi:MAG: hypothetical protein QFF03_04610 [Pseudomonadota bacterium]|nr:hypothetical protein [Pseudomonadota bacterium]